MPEENVETVDANEQIVDPATATEGDISGAVGTVEDPASSETPPVKKDGVQERINQLTRERRESDERAARLQGQVDILSQQPRQPEPQQTQVAAPVGPQAGDFDTDAEYQAALTKHITDQVTANLNQGTEERTRQGRYNARHEQVMEEAKTNPDIVPMLNDPAGKITETMLEAADGPMFAKVFLFLGNNSSERTRIMALTPAQQAKEIGKIEVKLSQEKPPPKKKTNAPDPTPGIGPGVGIPTDTTDPAKRSQNENMATWEKARLERAGVKTG